MRLLAAALLLTAGLTTAACRDTDRAVPTEMTADTMAGTSMGGMMDRPAYTDAHFLRQMTMHHRSAIGMAEMAQTKSTDPAVKAMAAKMATDQQAEVAEMTRMLQAIGETPDTTAMMNGGMMDGKNMMNGGGMMDGKGMMGDSGMMDGVMMGMPMTMDELRAAQPFDRAFLVSMIGHHATAITTSAEAQARSTSADVRRVAREIVVEQAEEIKKMQAMVDAMGAPSAP